MKSLDRLRDPSEKALGVLLLAPAFLLLALIVVYPIGKLIWNSFFDLRLSGGADSARFVGLENYTLVFKDADFWNAAANTVLITAITVPGALLLGMGLALLANLPFRRQWPVRLALLLPWALPLSFAGLIFAWFFHTEYGVVNDVMRRLGDDEPTMWLLRPGWAMTAICATIIWKTSSFMALILLAGLQMIPRDMYEAARIDGIHPVKVFFKVTLPLVKPALMVAVIFRLLDALRIFDLIYVLTPNSSATKTMSVISRENLIDFDKFAYGSAQSTLLFLIIALSVILYIWLGKVDLGGQKQ